MTPFIRTIAALAVVLPTIAAAQGLGYGTATTPAPAAEAGVRRFHIATVHLDGMTGLTATAAHPAEAFPTAPMPPGGGLLLRAPDAAGAWSVRAFLFEPSQIVVQAGDRVSLTFIGVQGPTHRIEVEGQGEPFTLRRGETRTVTLTASRPGTIAYRSLDRLPSMTGEILVLPR